VDLPLDIVFETAKYLNPKDLLELSRLSKQFRSIFASRSAIFVWRTVFRNADIKCLADLNELQFASLLYDRCCMACGRTMSMRSRCQIFPMLRLRLCPSCQTANLVTRHDLQSQYPNARDLIWNLPASSTRCFKPEAQLLIEKFLSLKHENSLQFVVNVEQHTDAKYQETITILHSNPVLQSIPNSLASGSIRTKQSCRGYGVRRR